ncbi:MAG: hypothetical protein V1678_01475 [Candidatus Aenigmatarchaeota archaeon]
MKAAISVLQAIMIFVIAVSMIAMVFPWAMETINVSFDMTEIKNIKSQFDVCSDRILDTARTGSKNRCIFNINSGRITGMTDGIYYTLLSNGPVCDSSPLVEIDARTHVWQSCNASGKQRTFVMKWMFPKEINITGTGVAGNKVAGSGSAGPVTFPAEIIFKTLSLGVEFQYYPGQSGKAVEMSRVNITSKNVTLSVDIQ